MSPLTLSGWFYAGSPPRGRMTLDRTMARAPIGPFMNPYEKR